MLTPLESKLLAIMMALIMLGMGAGLTWGSTLLEWSDRRKVR